MEATVGSCGWKLTNLHAPSIHNYSNYVYTWFKKVLKTVEAEILKIFKNIQPQPKIFTFSYKNKCITTKINVVEEYIQTLYNFYTCIRRSSGTSMIRSFISEMARISVVVLLNHVHSFINFEIIYIFLINTFNRYK